MQIIKHPNINFLRWRWHAIALSWVVIIAGIISMWTIGIPLGIEFAGGTSIILQFEQPTSAEAVRGALADHFQGGGSDAVIQPYGDPSRHEMLIRVPDVGAEQGNTLSTTAEAVENALRQGNVGAFSEQGREIVGPAVGSELRSRGIWATALSLVGVLIYIAFRYQLAYGVGAVVATAHDLLVALAFLSFFRYDMTLNVIAALLTVTGYSTNDTIVIFDRVRENLRSMRRDNLNHVINTAINQTLSRTLITSGTTLLSMIALFFFGGDVLRGFAFTMIIGVITGTYSSVFVAAAIVTLWRGKGPTRAAAHAPAPAGAPPISASAPAPAQRPSGRGKSKPQRKVRAS
jgi:preprotein translocase subunit SecF